MSFSVVQHASAIPVFNFGGATTGSLTVSFPSNISTGNAVVACIAIGTVTGTPSVSSVSTTGNDFWYSASRNTGPQNSSAIWITQNSGGGTNNVTINVAFGEQVDHAHGAVVLVDIYEVSGIARLGTAVDRIAGQSSGLTSNYSSGTISTTNVANEIWFGVVCALPPFGSTESINPPSGWTNSSQLTNFTWQANVQNAHVYSLSGYQIVSSTGTGNYASTFLTSNAQYGAVMATFMADPVSSDSFANQGESGTVTATIPDSDSAANQGETGTVQATLSSTDSYFNQGETTYLIETFASSDSFANQGETNLVLQIITDTDSFANQGETALAFQGIQDFSESAHFMEMSNLTEFPSPPPGFLTTFYPTILRPVTSPIYYGRARKSAVQPSMWKTTFRNTSVKASNFRVVSARKNAQAATTWTTLHRVEVIRVGALNGLPRPIVAPIDWPYRADQIAWRNEVRKSASTRTTWNTTQRKTGISRKKIAWNVRVSNLNQQIVQYRALVRVSVPESAPFNFAGIDRPVVYPIIPTYRGSGSLIQWRLNSRLVPSQRVTWMVRIPVKVQQKTSFNDKAIHVFTTQQITWMLKKKVTATQQIAWRDVTRTYNRKAIFWHDNFRLSAQKAVSFRVRNKVTATTVIQWKMVAHVIARSRSTFNDRLAVKPQARTTWMTRYRYYATPIPPPQVVYAGKVVDQVVHPLGSMQGFAPNKKIQWRVPIYHVLAQSPTGFAGVTTIEWNARKRISASKRVTWNTVGRTNVKQITVYNALVPVKPQVVIQWNVGSVLVQRIHTSAQNREDFAY